MTILVPPLVFGLPSRFSFALQAHTQSGGRSPFDGTEQTLEQPGARWAGTLGWEGLTADEWRPLMAFLATLGGRAGRFAWGPPVPRRGTRTGGVVAGAGQVGKQLATSGWAGAGFVARAGDWIGWTGADGRPALHMVTADVDVGAATTATLPIAPAIRRSPAAGAALALAAPTSVWRLAGDRNPLDIARGLIAGGSLDIEETLV